MSVTGSGTATASRGGPASSQVLAGGFWTAMTQFAPYVYTTITSIIAARVLGPDDMGRQSFIAFLVLTVQTVSTSGVGYALVRYVGELTGGGELGRFRPLVAFAWRLAIPTSVAGGAGVLMATVGGAQPRGAWIFAAVAALAGGLNNVPIRALIGAHRWRGQSNVLLTTGGLSVFATIGVLALGWGITGMLAVTAATGIAIFVWSMLLLGRLLRTVPRESIPLDRTTKHDFVRFAIGNYVPILLNFVVQQRSEFFFLERFSSDSQIAIYSIGYSLMLALLALPTAVRMVVAPSVAALVAAGDFDRIRRGFGRLVRMTLLLSIPLAAAALAFGPALIRLVYGGRYAAAGDVLLILAVPLPLVPLSSGASGLLIGYGRIRVPTLISAAAAAVDIAAAAVLVPRIDADGAAVANVLALVTMSALLLPYSYRLVGGFDVSVPHVVRTLVAAALAGGLGRSVLELGGGGAIFAGGLAVGVGAFCVLAWLLKIVPAVDADWLGGMARARGIDRLGRVLDRVAS